MNLKKFLLSKIKNKDLYCDIETFSFNKLAKKPSDLKNEIYSIAVSYYYLEKEYFYYSNDFKELLSFFSDNSIKGNVTMFFHNGRKYDNHYLLRDLKYYYNVKTFNTKTRQQNFHSDMDVTLTKLKTFNNTVLEQRVKTKNSVDLVFNLNGNIIKVVDTLPKIPISIEKIGVELLRLGLVNEDELKTSYDYEKYDTLDDLNIVEAKKRSKKIYNSLTKDDKIYQRNDVIILMRGVKYFSKIYPGFSFDEITFSQNILKSYPQDDITNYQLLRSYNKSKIKLSEYRYDSDKNIYQYLKCYYKGGINILNDEYVGKIVKDCFSIDINNSYGAVMYFDKIPTFIKSFSFNEEITVKKSKEFAGYEIYKKDFNLLLKRIKSKIVKNILVKYYQNSSNKIYVTNSTFNIVLEFLNAESLKIKTISTFKCSSYYFGGRDVVFNNFALKTEAKINKKIIFNKDMTKYKIKNKKVFHTVQEMNVAKLKNNALYGLPGIRSSFPIFKMNTDREYENYAEGFVNSERNILFSISITSRGLEKWFKPLTMIPQNEIDDLFVYGDTDSVYLKNKAKKYVTPLVDSYLLGSWDLEHNINKIYVANHKKYLYEDDNKKIYALCGGVSKKSIESIIKEKYKSPTFENYLKEFYEEGCVIKTNKSILTKSGTINIYQASIIISHFKKYPEYFLSRNENLINEIKKILKVEDLQDSLYVESVHGTISSTDLINNESKKNEELKTLKDFLEIETYIERSIINE